MRGALAHALVRCSPGGGVLQGARPVEEEEGEVPREEAAQGQHQERLRRGGHAAPHLPPSLSPSQRELPFGLTPFLEVSVRFWIRTLALGHSVEECARKAAGWGVK